MEKGNRTPKRVRSESSLAPLILPSETKKNQLWSGLTHRSKVLAFLMANITRGISTFDMRSHGVNHPAGRIQELRDTGFEIATEWVRPAGCINASRDYALYKLVLMPDQGNLSEVA